MCDVECVPYQVRVKYICELCDVVGELQNLSPVIGDGGVK